MIHQAFRTPEDLSSEKVMQYQESWLQYFTFTSCYALI